MSNPLENREFRHFLNFKSDDTGIIEISEPVKFDASEFIIEQDNYSRDVSLMNEEISLEFRSGFHEFTNQQYQLPNGIVTNQLGHALEWILEYNSAHGFESEIEYILERNDVQFILGELNFEDADTDELTYFNCKVIQSTKRALARRREDVKINAFSDKDLDNNDITPLQTQNILLKAKPVTQNSEWYSPRELNNVYLHLVSVGLVPITTDSYTYYNNCNGVMSYGIQDTLSFFETVKSTRNTSEYNTIGEDFNIIKAVDDLTNVKITLTDIDFSQEILPVVNPPQTVGGYANTSLNVFWGEDFDNLIGSEVLFEEEVLLNDGLSNINFSASEIIVNIDAIPRDNFVWIFFRTIVHHENFPNNSFSYVRIETDLAKYDIQATATSTAIDTVIKGVRYIDLVKQGLKATNGMSLSAPEFESEGEFYDLFAFSGNLIRQRDDVPFYFTLKDRKENLAVMNADLQINDDDAFVLQYDKFYDNVDNGGFSAIPDDSFVQSYNERYAVNILEWKFKNYEKDRDESNTLDGVHTEAQFSINNTKVQTTKSISIGDTYDPFKIESQRRQAFKETTALDGDDKIHCLDTIPLAPGIKGGFIASMDHNINSDDNLQLLKDVELPSWALLGFGVGDLFEIVSGENIGIYTVSEIETTIITLTPNGFTPTFTGTALTEVSYNYTNVNLTNRTDEEFDLIENLLNPDNFSNLRYTIRRNLKHWEPYLSTCASYIEQDISNSEFKNNGELRTQYQGGSIYQENGDIVLNDIETQILTPKIYSLRVVVEYDDILTLLQKYQQLETVGGFIRIENLNEKVLKLYPQSLGYTWATRVLEITGEERFESDVVTVTKVDDVIYVNEVGYEQDQLAKVFYESKGDYMTLLDVNNIKIINYTKYDKFEVSGQTFGNIIELNQAIIDL